jgi:hypothetical protein
MPVVKGLEVLGTPAEEKRETEVEALLGSQRLPEASMERKDGLLRPPPVKLLRRVPEGENSSRLSALGPLL